MKVDYNKKLGDIMKEKKNQQKLLQAKIAQKTKIKIDKRDIVYKSQRNNDDTVELSDGEADLVKVEKIKIKDPSTKTKFATAKEKRITQGSLGAAMTRNDALVEMQLN